MRFERPNVSSPRSWLIRRSRQCPRVARTRHCPSSKWTAGAPLIADTVAGRQRTADFHLGKLVEAGETEPVFAQPGLDPTQDYVTGRFGG